MKKVLLAPISQQPKFDKTGIPENIVAEDGCGIAVALGEEYQCDILTKPQKTRWVTATDFWDDDEWDWNQYDIVVLYPQIPPFYAGVCQPKVVKYVKALLKYEGKIVFHDHDPLHQSTNFLERVHYRLYELESKLKFTEGFDPYSIPAAELKANLDKTDLTKQERWTIWPNAEGTFVDSLRTTFEHVRQQPNTLNFRNEEICYAGANRPARQKRLKELGLDGGQVQFLGPITGKGRAKKITEVNTWMREYTHTLILGDPGHAGRGLNHRLLQGLSAQCVCLIDSRLDPDRKLILDPTLQEYLYFDGPHDVCAKYLFTLKHYGVIIDLQDNELKRIFDESQESLIRRTHD